jgi:hypothetical protein
LAKNPVEKAGDLSAKAAIITFHSYLPSPTTQLNAAWAWGIPEMPFQDDDVSPIWLDDVRGVRTTYWPKRLPQRQHLLDAYGQDRCPGHAVFFYNPLCVGFSKAHAKSVIDVLFSAEVAMFVHDQAREYRPGDNLSEFWREHARQLKNAQMKQYRTKQSFQSLPSVRAERGGLEYPDGPPHTQKKVD